MVPSRRLTLWTPKRFQPFVGQGHGGAALDQRQCRSTLHATLLQLLGLISKQPILTTGTIQIAAMDGTVDCPALRSITVAIASSSHSYSLEFNKETSPA